MVFRGFGIRDRHENPNQGVAFGPGVQLERGCWLELDPTGFELGSKYQRSKLQKSTLKPPEISSDQREIRGTPPLANCENNKAQRTPAAGRSSGSAGPGPRSGNICGCRSHTGARMAGTGPPRGRTAWPYMLLHMCGGRQPWGQGFGLGVWQGI